MVGGVVEQRSLRIRIVLPLGIAAAVLNRCTKDSGHAVVRADGCTHVSKPSCCKYGTAVQTACDGYFCCLENSINSNPVQKPFLVLQMYVRLNSTLISSVLSS